MSMKWAALAAAAVPLGVAVPAQAHHSIQAEVDTGKIVESEMVLTKVDWINPHSWFHFTPKSGKGAATVDVMIEWLSLPGLRQAGYATPGVFTLGDTYSVSFNPNRDNSPGGNLVSMTDESTGQVFSRGGPNQPPPSPPPPAPQLRPSGALKTNVSY